MFEKSSAGNGSSSCDANYPQYRQALRYRSDRCSLGADRADVTGSPTRRPTTHNQHSRCVKRHLLSTTNRLPMAFASPRVSSVEHGLSLLPSLEERWCLDLRPALNVSASSTASRSDRLSVGRHPHSHSGCRTPKSQARSTPAAARWLEATDRQTSAACLQDHRPHLDCRAQLRLAWPQSTLE